MCAARYIIIMYIFVRVIYIYIAGIRLFRNVAQAADYLLL